MAETEPTTHKWRSEVPGDPQWDDLARRWMASDRQRAAAQAILAGLPAEYELCYVPIALVGKRRMVWSSDVVVEHVHAYFPSKNRGDERPDPRNLCEDAAYATLGGRPGTTCYAAVWRDGNAAVFEGMRRVEHDDDEEGGE